MRAEARFDGLAGCLRTPAGGSSRQFLLDIEGGIARARLIGAREAARLMGLPDSYRLPARRNEAYHLLGDGVVAPVVRFLSESLLLPLAEAGRSSDDGRAGSPSAPRPTARPTSRSPPKARLARDVANWLRSLVVRCKAKSSAAMPHSASPPPSAPPSCGR